MLCLFDDALPLQGGRKLCHAKTSKPPRTTRQRLPIPFPDPSPPNLIPAEQSTSTLEDAQPNPFPAFIFSLDVIVKFGAALIMH